MEYKVVKPNAEIYTKIKLSIERDDVVTAETIKELTNKILDTVNYSMGVKVKLKCKYLTEKNVYGRKQEILEYHYEKFKVRVETDPRNPRTDNDNAGRIVVVKDSWYDKEYKHPDGKDGMYIDKDSLNQFPKFYSHCYGVKIISHSSSDIHFTLTTLGAEKNLFDMYYCTNAQIFTPNAFGITPETTEEQIWSVLNEDIKELDAYHNETFYEIATSNTDYDWCGEYRREDIENEVHDIFRGLALKNFINMSVEQEKSND